MDNRSHIHEIATSLGFGILAYEPRLRSALPGQLNDGCRDGLGRLFPAVRRVIVRSVCPLSRQCISTCVGSRKQDLRKRRRGDRTSFLRKRTPATTQTGPLRVVVKEEVIQILSVRFPYLVCRVLFFASINGDIST